MREIGDIVREFERRRGEPLALATLVQTRGSSYRRSGARMLIAADGKAVGSLSGGCLEAEVVEKARQVLRTGKPALMAFDTRRRFGCNGALEILVERVSIGFLAELAGHFHARRPCCIATAFAGECASRLVSSADEVTDGELRQRIEPPPQLLIVGTGPDSIAMDAFAEALGWLVRPIESAGELDGPYDEWTAAIVKTHNYGRDFAALRTLLPLGLRYIGLIGPRARREQLLGDLLDTGIAAGPNLFAPAGLDLGGDAPEAIALSIVAEIQAVFAGGSRQSLRERKAPIHTPRAEPVPLSEMETIGAVILAAGGSTRLGQPKQLLLHQGESLVHRAARVAREAGCSPVMVVVGDEREQIAVELRTVEAHVTHHPDWRLGIGSSIRAGVAQALAQSPALEVIIIMVCDQPFVSADILKALIVARAQTTKCAAACLYAGSIGVPAIFDRSLFPLLTTLPDAQGAQSILSARSGEIAHVNFPQGNIDIDTPDDCHLLSSVPIPARFIAGLAGREKIVALAQKVAASVTALPNRATAQTRRFHNER